MPIAWTIAGSDCSAGAGIQADLKTFRGLNVYGCSVITAITAQNTTGVQSIHLIDAPVVARQLEALRFDFPPRAIKIGMLGSVPILETVAQHCREIDAVMVCDPVLASTSQTALIAPEGIQRLKELLFPWMDMITPNLPEAEQLSGMRIANEADLAAAADYLLSLGCGSVYIKGGHREGDVVRDYWTNGTVRYWLTLPRIETRHTHGTGCTFSSAIAAAWARGLDDVEACELARAYVQQGLRQAPGLGKGRGPLAHDGEPDALLYPTRTPA